MFIGGNSDHNEYDIRGYIQIENGNISSRFKIARYKFIRTSLFRVRASELEENYAIKNNRNIIRCIPAAQVSAELQSMNLFLGNFKTYWRFVVERWREIVL